MTKILVVDDEMDQLNLLFLMLKKGGYDVVRASSGAEAMEVLRAEPPDLVISDVNMPDISGLQLATMMNMDLVLRSIPIILTSGRNVTTEDEIAGLTAGCDGYINKPFSASKLLAYVEASFRRREIGMDANPLTRLPGNSSILRRLERVMASREPFAALYVDLNNFKGFNDRYGFLKGDEVIRFTGHILLKANQKVYEGRDFVGHVGGDDFVVVTSPQRIEAFCHTIIKMFDDGVYRFYQSDDLERGYIETLDRQDKPVRYPIMGVAIAVVTNENRRLSQVGQVSQIAAELKHYVKSFNKSHYQVDRRKD